MTGKQYLAVLKKLDLTPASKRTARLLGISVRQAQRYAAAAGEEIPETVALLLACYLAHGLPEE